MRLGKKECGRPWPLEKVQAQTKVERYLGALLLEPALVPSQCNHGLCLVGAAGGQRKMTRR